MHPVQIQCPTQRFPALENCFLMVSSKHMYMEDGTNNENNEIIQFLQKHPAYSKPGLDKCSTQCKQVHPHTDGNHQGRNPI